MNVLEHFQEITTFVFDVDGVLTDSTVLLLDNGLQARQMHVKDGLAMQMALKNDYRIMILSGGNSEPVRTRMHFLGITEVHLGVKDKLQVLTRYLEENQLNKGEVLFMGDDLPDLAVLQQVGLPCCPSDAVMEVKKVSKYISPLPGGKGCVRDVIEKVLKLNDHWNYDTEVASR
jgi:3-deoxy-D-manno-octulosonate 8-phosphate phosphatase (KDO 8-P phosphatase)